jgi:hypothetical protein
MTTWQIGESGTTIALDGTGKGEVTFTVSKRVALTVGCHEGDTVCDDIPDATGNGYRILPENADHEFRVRVRVRVVSGDEEATVRVGPTELVPNP